MDKDFKNFVNSKVPDYDNITNKELKKKTIKVLKKQYKNKDNVFNDEDEKMKNFFNNIGLKELEIISRGELLDVAVFCLYSCVKNGNGLSYFFETLTTGTKFDAWEIYECLTSSNLFSKELLSLIAQAMTIFDFAIDEHDTIADVEKKRNTAFELLEEKIDPLLLVYEKEVKDVTKKISEKY